MILSRRTALVLPAALLAIPYAIPGARADTGTIAERGLGDTAAPVNVAEWFSLTCPHCAAFARDALPVIEDQLVKTGKVRIVFRDFPLDQVALMAAMVARSLPEPRYVPFIEALLASQDRWAFARGVNSTEEIAKMAALAGMPRDSFNAAIANTALRNTILAQQEEAEKVLKVDSTSQLHLQRTRRPRPQGSRRTIPRSLRPHRRRSERLTSGRRFARQLHPPAHRRFQEFRGAGDAGRAAPASPASSAPTAAASPTWWRRCAGRWAKAPRNRCAAATWTT